MGPAMDEDVSSSLPRKQSITGTPPQRPGSGVPTTFFLRSEEEMNTVFDAKDDQPTGTLSSTIQDSSYGVQSLEDAIGSALTENGQVDDGHKSTVLGKRKSPKNPVHPKIIAAAQRILSSESPGGSSRASSPSQNSGRRLSQFSISQPLTPLHLSPTPGSGVPSTPKTGSLKSFKLSDDESIADEIESQAVESGNEDELESHGDRTTAQATKAPQLVMPSIKMPTRRPFTDRGKRIGKLKILVAGASGTGKTSLIRSILQCCEHIVHVDPLPTSQSLPQNHEDTGQRSSQIKEGHIHTTDFVEIQASTRSYPSWWTDVEESKTLRRRKSMGDVVLERNICFIDSPGHDSREIFQADSDPTIRYIDRLLHRNATFKSLTEHELLHILSGNGGVQVDLVLYVISNEGHNATDVEVLSRLCPTTNVMPIIGKADMIEPEAAVSLKSKLLQDLRNADTRPFLFGKTVEECLKEPSECPPFVVSSATDSDADTMDASLLMSSEYMQPLLPSELYSLVDQMFEPENAAWLRHSAARKFLQWRSTRHGKSMLMNKNVISAAARTFSDVGSPMKKGRSQATSPDLTLSPTSSQGLLAHSTSPAPSPPASTSPSEHQHALSLFGNHTQRGNQFAEVRLAKWAADLQQSLNNERDRYERLARGERANWLADRLEECSAEMTEEKEKRLILTRQFPGRRRSGRLPRGPIEDPADPLGLLRFADRVGQNGWVVMQVLGGCGLAGALAVWIWRSWDTNSGSSWDSWFSNMGLDNWGAWSFAER